jgi:hypothetical protein
MEANTESSASSVSSESLESLKSVEEAEEHECLEIRNKMFKNLVMKQREEIKILLKKNMYLEDTLRNKDFYANKVMIVCVSIFVSFLFYLL